LVTVDAPMPCAVFSDIVAVCKFFAVFAWFCSFRDCLFFSLIKRCLINGCLQPSAIFLCVFPAVASVDEPWTRHCWCFWNVNFVPDLRRICSGGGKVEQLDCRVHSGRVSMTSVWKKFYDCSCQRRRCNGTLSAKPKRQVRYLDDNNDDVVVRRQRRRLAHPQRHPRITRPSSSSTSVYRRRLAVVCA